MEVAIKAKELLFQQYIDAGDFSSALSVVEPVLRSLPDNPHLLHDAALCHLRLGDLGRCIDYEHKALKIDSAPGRYRSFDALAEAYGRKGDLTNCRKYGCKALTARDSIWGNQPLPGVLSGRVRAQKKLVSFSLFGSAPRYIETGYLNVIRQQELLPDWTCRFYVDDSVAENHLARLKSAGAELVHIHGRRKKIPGTMWRFLALDDQSVGRTLCRDADSLITAREVGMIRQWEQGGEVFHVIRDYCTHTELVLAGLWGAINGCLPPVEPMIENFLAEQVRIYRFSDQNFLRDSLWQYIKNNHLAHDRMFGFLSDTSLPEYVELNANHILNEHHIGANECTSRVRFNMAGRQEIRWQLRSSSEEVICQYSSKIVDGAVSVDLPREYVDRIKNGDMQIQLV